MRKWTAGVVTGVILGQSFAHASDDPLKFYTLHSEVHPEITANSSNAAIFQPTMLAITYDVHRQAVVGCASLQLGGLRNLGMIPVRYLMAGQKPLDVLYQYEVFDASRRSS